MNHERECLRLVAALAEWPSLTKRIVEQHNPTGVCRACTTPGGRMVVTAPCLPRQLALHAKAVIAGRVRMIGGTR